MTLDDVKRLFRFNDWANRATFDGLTEIPTCDYLQDLKSSHGGIHGTLTYLAGAEKLWLARWRGSPDAKLMSPAEVGSLSELRGIWERTMSDRNDFVASLTEETLRSDFTIRTTTGATFVHPYWQMFQHVVNHSSYHRGQIAAMMRQLGHKPPQTDLIKFYRDFAFER